ncbi:hypothetical protein SETIT_5G115400v2 [Setaria italica]|uniref:ABC-2 type transporter transmembrane domain-containing protein n=1 Tax=Setaria italica TaxID=4555 RepID=K3XT01_SETIT|nr:hypothetical protein SETIT_5G115400v2 [Setaria italica]
MIMSYPSVSLCTSYYYEEFEKNCNPTTWMMDITSASMEFQLNIDFASAYQESPLHRDMQELVEKLSNPLPNSENLCFSYCFPQSRWGSPQYNLNRMVMTIMIALIFGVLYWRHAKILTWDTTADLFNVLGAMYMGAIQLGVYNDQSIISFSTTECIVMYREKVAGMYSSWAYSFAQAATEIPYVFIQVLLYTFIFFYTTFCLVLCYVYVGLLLVSVTPNSAIEAIWPYLKK